MSSKFQVNVICLLSFVVCALGAFYEPSPTVKMVNSYPHFNAYSLDASSDKWSTDGDYYVGVAGLAAVVLVLGIVALVIMPILLCLRCCCTCLKCAPNQETPTYQDSKGNEHYNKNWFVFGSYYVVCLAAFVMAHLMWAASDSFSKAIQESVDTLGDLEDIFQNLKDDTQDGKSDTEQAINDLNSFVSSDVCYTAAQEMLTAINILDTTLDTMYDGVKVLPGYMASASEEVEKGDAIQASVLYSCYAGIMVVIGVYLLLEFCHLKCGLKIMMPISWFVVLVLTVLCSIELVILMVTCDFCMDPAGAILDNSSGALYDVVNDYVSRDANGTACTNSNSAKLQGYLDDIQDAFSKSMSNSTIAYDACDTLGGTSADLAKFTSANTSLYSFNDVLGTMSDTLDCNNIHNLWVGVLETALCKYFTDGMYYFWLSKHLTAVFLYLLMCLGSVTWQYFGIVDDDDAFADADDDAFVTGGIVIRDNGKLEDKKEKSVVELTKRDNSGGRLRGIF